MTDGLTDRDRASYLDEVVESAGVLDSLTEAAAAEAWASGAVAEWFRLGGRALAEELAGRAPIAESVIRWIESGLVPAPGPAIPWIPDIGSARPVAAVRLVDPDQEDDVVLIVEFESDSGARHDLSVTLRRRCVVDVAVAPSGLSAAARDAPDARFVTETIDARSGLADSLADVRTALERTRPTDLADRARLDVPLLCRRLGFDPDGVRELIAEPGEDPPEIELVRDVEDDRYAAELVRSALATAAPAGLSPSAPAAPTIRASLEAVVQAFVGRVHDGDPDVLAAMAVAGVSPSDVSGDPETALVRTAGAYLAPVDLSPHPRGEQAPIAALEPADWVGVILGVLRDQGTTPLTGSVAVTYVNRCPEIATSIPARDAESVAWAFDRTLYSWECTGVLDELGLLTPIGRWILPQAVALAWADSSGS